MGLGQGALGLGVSYLMAAGYLVVMWLVGKRLIALYPLEQKTKWDTRTIARVTILAAVSGAGAMIKIPGPATTIALDASAGFFAGAFFGWPVGATVAAIGCFLANALGGFASWLPLVPVYLAAMACTVTVATYVDKRVNIVAAVIVATVLNTVTCLAPWLIMVGLPLMIAILPSQLIGSAANSIIGLTVARTLRNAQEHKRPEQAEPLQR